MSDAIKVTATSVDEQRFFARIEGAQLERIVAEAVAKAAGIDLNGAGVSVERCYIKQQDRGSCGFVPQAEVSIVIDRTQMPKADEGGAG